MKQKGLRLGSDWVKMQGSGRGNRVQKKTYSKGHWRHEEDRLLMELIEEHGPRNWNGIASHIKGRSGKSCRLRWVNQLSPQVKKSPFNADEEEKLLQLHKIHGNRWATIAQSFPGRTDNQVKNQFHVMMSKKKKQQKNILYAGYGQNQLGNSTSEIETGSGLLTSTVFTLGASPHLTNSGNSSSSPLFNYVGTGNSFRCEGLHAATLPNIRRLGIHPDQNFQLTDMYGNLSAAASSSRLIHPNLSSTIFPGLTMVAQRAQGSNLVMNPDYYDFLGVGK